MCNTGVGPSGERCLVQKCGCNAKRDKFGGDAAAAAAAALRLDSLTIHLRANGSRLLSLARFLFSNPAFYFRFANNVLDCTIFRDQVSATKQIRWTPSPSTAAGGPRPSTTTRHGRGGGAPCTAARPTIAGMWEDRSSWWCNMSDIL